MKDKFTLSIEVVDGQMTANSITKTRLDSWLFGYTGKIYATYDKRKPKRSLGINAFYWAVVLPLVSDDTGHTPEELHILFKGMFLTKEIKKVLGKDVRVTRSTTDLATGEFIQYLDKIVAETKIVIPTLEEAGYISN